MSHTPSIPEVGAQFVSELVVSFRLPGTRQSSCGNRGGQEYQLEAHHWDETWTIKVNADNALATAAVFRAVAQEIERVNSLK